MIELLIDRNGDIFSPPIVGDLVWTTERQSAPSTLKFSVMKSATKSFLEGDPVRLKVDGKEVFFGFVFRKERTKENIISVTCYDQLRYLKNKDTIVYENKTAGELIKMLAEDYKLNLGNIADTEYKIESRVEDNQTLFDIIQSALTATLTNKGKMYVLYDDFGKLTLKGLADMKLDYVVDTDTAQDFAYSSTIDETTYNQIKLSYEDSEGGKREIYIAKDSSNINNWGLLQYHDSVKEGENGQAKADALLKLYNVKTRTLQIKNALGDVRVRAGTLIPVVLKLGDVNVSNYMLVEKAQHTISNGEHWMNLYVRGGEFV